jgi:hypothetical protein
VLGYGLPSVEQPCTADAGVTAFQRDHVDGYTARSLSPFSTMGLGLVSRGYADDLDVPTRPWVGAEHAEAFFTTQDLLDRTKTSTPGGGFKFVDRLQSAGTNISTYDRYTYYRLLSQLGTDSAPEDPDKLHLNYVNVGRFAVTNYLRWDDPTFNFVAEFGVPASVLFFTNAADRMLRHYSTEWLAADYAVYTNRFWDDQIITLTNIPVVVSNQFVYSPALHRILQVAANIWDTKDNPRAVQGLPTVFQPMFAMRNGNVYITNFVEVTSTADFPALAPVDLLAMTDRAAFLATNPPNILVYGVPPVVGARKGLPNFNEFQFEPIVTMTRKLQLRRAAGLIDQTNQFFTMSVAIPQAAEFWNSYATNFAPPYVVAITNFTTLTMTNDLGINFSRFFTTGERINSVTNWPSRLTGKRSFVEMVRTNLPGLPTLGYLPGPSSGGLVGFVSATNLSVFDESQNLIMPRWGLTISNRVQAMITRPDGRIIDYVVLGNMVYQTNLTDLMSDATSGTGDAYAQVWATNTSPVNPNLLTSRLGVIQQINISAGYAGSPPPPDEWRGFGANSESAVLAAIAGFRNFYDNPSSNGTVVVPYTPTYQFRVPMIWQANDPLVHYMSSDMFHLEKSRTTSPHQTAEHQSRRAARRDWLGERALQTVVQRVALRDFCHGSRCPQPGA